MARGPTQTPRITNKKARHDFEVLETVEAGIALSGCEVKSLRAGKASIEESYIVIRDGETYLIGCNISPYENASYGQVKPTRERKLLLHRRQIRKWQTKVTQRGLTIVPLEVYFSERGIAKLSIALVRGKTHGDKRADLKKREHTRDMERAMRRRR